MQPLPIVSQPATDHLQTEKYGPLALFLYYPIPVAKNV